MDVAFMTFAELCTDLSWLDGMLSDSREVVIELLREPSMCLVQLRTEVEAYRDAIIAAGDVADQEVGDRLVVGVLGLIDAVLPDGPDRQRLAQVAVRYFVLDDDGDDDLASQFGLDDDVEVFNTVVAQLQLPNLLIE